jgi:hypothetical protein
LSTLPIIHLAINVFLILQDGTNFCTETFLLRSCYVGTATTSIVNVAADMALSFMESIKSGDGTRSGAIIATYKVDTPLIALESGKTFDFYVRNYSPVYAGLTLPAVASGQVVGSDKVQTFN